MPIAVVLPLNGQVCRRQTALNAGNSTKARAQAEAFRRAPLVVLGRWSGAAFAGRAKGLGIVWCLPIGSRLVAERSCRGSAGRACDSRDVDSLRAQTDGRIQGFSGLLQNVPALGGRAALPRMSVPVALLVSRCRFGDSFVLVRFETDGARGVAFGSPTERLRGGSENESSEDRRSSWETDTTHVRVPHMGLSIRSSGPSSR